ncbi:MAG TPA: pilus assembly protein [Hyphomicrobium sp.]|nr:pilus assembly protein [Hyphomicrobium sp.]
MNTQLTFAFGRDRSGSVGYMFALGCCVLLGFAGLAVDYSRVEKERSDLQRALDTSVLAAAALSVQGDDINPIQKAESIFGATVKSGTASATFTNVGGTIRGLAQTNVRSVLAGVVGFKSFEVAVSSAARSGAVYEPMCIMAMHPKRKHTLELDGAVSVYAPDCHVYGNSDDLNDVVDLHKSANYLTAKSIQAIGYGHNYLENLTPPLEYAPERIPDPLASLPIEFPGACSKTDLVITNTSATLDPGTYCGGLKLRNGAQVKLRPGLYVFTRNPIDIQASSLEGDGVTLVLADASVTLLFDQARVFLTAPWSGSDAGIAIKGVRSATSNTFNNSTIDIHGVVYMPNGALLWTNTGDYSPRAKWTVWIMDGFSWKGDGTIRVNFNIKDSGVPYPSELRTTIPRGGLPRLVSG